MPTPKTPAKPTPETTESGYRDKHGPITLDHFGNDIPFNDDVDTSEDSLYAKTLAQIEADKKNKKL